jgi:hypothetical protein
MPADPMNVIGYEAAGRQLLAGAVVAVLALQVLLLQHPEGRHGRLEPEQALRRSQGRSELGSYDKAVKLLEKLEGPRRRHAAGPAGPARPGLCQLQA